MSTYEIGSDLEYIYIKMSYLGKYANQIKSD